MGTRLLLALYRETIKAYTCYRFNSDGFAKLRDLYEKLVACVMVEEVNALIVTLLKKRMELYNNTDQVQKAPPDSQKCCHSNCCSMITVSPDDVHAFPQSSR